MCVLAGTATGVCLEKGPRMSDISGESTGTDVPVCAKCGTPFDLYGGVGPTRRWSRVPCSPIGCPDRRREGEADDARQRPTGPRPRPR